jgi:hypothetical protein
VNLHLSNGERRTNLLKRFFCTIRILKEARHARGGQRLLTTLVSDGSLICLRSSSLACRRSR